ncbi:hypothetical protein PFLUV_G00100960 [Perca fluviatilis]|uniref:Uncharacterized protein n=1 Tax=Perca fluviatilis TaxID=8168 RepID=A0A6A5FFA2_PERFL|nr:hypothetical protein PFLUV_G00100960 [Perca fluviatilis]
MLLDQQEMEQESGTNLKNLFRGSGRSPGIRNLKFPPSIEDLQDYQRYHEGSCPTSKQLENAQSKVSRVAWAEICLKGSPNFTDLRTAVSAHVKNNLLSGSRRWWPPLCATTWPPLTASTPSA